MAELFVTYSKASNSRYDEFIRRCFSVLNNLTRNRKSTSHRGGLMFAYTSGRINHLGIQIPATRHSETKRCSYVDNRYININSVNCIDFHGETKNTRARLNFSSRSVFKWCLRLNDDNESFFEFFQLNDVDEAWK